MATGAPVLDTVSINGVTVDSYKSPTNGASWSMETNEDRSTIREIEIWLARNVTDVLTMDNTLNEQDVIIQRGVSSATEEKVFQGIVVNHSPVGGKYRVTCADKLFLTTKSIITKTFDINIDTEAGVISEIFKTLINDYTSLTCDDTSVQNSGTTLTLAEFKCKSVDVFSCLKRLAEALGWQFYYDPITDLVYFEPVGYQNNSTTLRTGVNIVKTPEWEQDSTQLFNYVELRGAITEVETDVDGRIGTDAGFTTSSITLPQTPSSVKVYADSSNPPTTLRTGGNASVDVYDYEVLTDRKLVEWNTSQYTPGATDYVHIDLSYFVPVPVIVEDADSIATYSNNDPEKVKKKVLQKPEITKRDDAEKYADQYLQDHKDPIKKAKDIEVTNVSGLRVGQRVEIIDDYNTDYSGEYQIIGIKIGSPYKSDKITVASTVIDEELYAFNIAQRVKRLEEENIGDNDLLLFVKSHKKTTKIKKWYSQGESRTLANTTGRYSHARYGILGTNQAAPSSLPSYSAFYIIPGGNEYREFLRTDTFEGSGSATWNTSTNTLSFTASQTKTTGQIALGTAYTYFTVTLGSSTGSILVEISGDNGSTWQTVTLGTRTAFTSSDGTGVLLRFTETGAAAASITPSTDSYNNQDDPAIKCTLEV